MGNSASRLLQGQAVLMLVGSAVHVGASRYRLLQGRPSAPFKQLVPVDVYMHSWSVQHQHSLYLEAPSGALGQQLC